MKDNCMYNRYHSFFAPKCKRRNEISKTFAAFFRVMCVEEIGYQKSTGRCHPNRVLILSELL